MRLLILLSALIMSAPAIAATSCFPPGHKMGRSIDIAADAISHANFNKAIDKVYNHYAPIVKAKGYNLVFNRAWDDDTVNSDTDTEGRDWVINSYGGLARWPGMNTIAAYAFVACHELGHHMGGAPLFSDSGPWGGGGPAVEGEADYWAAKECMKAIGYSMSTIVAGGTSLADVLADLGGEPKPSKTKIDTSVVRRTYEDHPESQCRLDTYLNGAACPMRGVMSESNPRVNSCYGYPTKKTYAIGDRPRCWFAP